MLVSCFYFYLVLCRTTDLFLCQLILVFFLFPKSLHPSLIWVKQFVARHGYFTRSWKTFHPFNLNRFLFQSWPLERCRCGGEKWGESEDQSHHTAHHNNLTILHFLTVSDLADSSSQGTWANTSLKPSLCMSRSAPVVPRWRKVHSSAPV